MTGLENFPIYGLIPVKSFSKRFPEKNFSEFCGTNMIKNTIEKLVKARTDKIYISTDYSKKVIEYIKTPPVAYNELYIIDRFTNESEEKSEISINEVVMDFIEHTDLPSNYIIALCQVTSPNWSPHRLTYALEKLKQHNKTVISVSPDYKPNGCFYIFTKNQFLEHQDIYNHDNGIYLVKIPWEESSDIDYQYQLLIAEAISRGDYDT